MTSSKDSGLNPADLWDILRQHRRTTLLFLGVVLVVALVGTKLSTPIYEAIALIQLMPRAGQEVDVNAVVSFDEAGYLERRDRARTQIQVILSRSVRESVIAAYNEAGYDDLSGRDGTDELKERMTVGPREDTQLVEIRVEHHNPERAAVLANLVAEVYRGQNLAARTEAARDTQVWLEGQTGTYREDLQDATQSIISFKESNDLIDIEEKVDDITRRMTALQVALGEVTTGHALLESQISEHRRLLRNNQYDILVSAFESPALNALSEQHALVLTETAEVFARYEERHPTYKQAVERIGRVEALIAEEIGRLVEGERAELRIFTRQLVRLNSELDLVKVELLDKQRLQDNYDTLKMEENRLRKLYGSLSERGAEVELQSRTRLNDVRIIELAVPPRRPARPNLPLNMVVALLVGLGGGIGLALLRYRLDDTIRSIPRTEALLDVPLLGSLPLLSPGLTVRQRALFPHTNPQSPTAESFRAIRAILNVTPSSKDPRTLVIMTHQRFLITSSQPAEGKTETILGLAISFASLGIATLVIDADMRRPRIHNLLDLDQAPGLADALSDETENPLEMVEPTAVPNLYALPCGAMVNDPNELLTGTRFREVLTTLSKRFPMVLIDSPPVLPVSDSLVMAADTDVIMLVRSGTVREEHAVRTLARLRRAGARVRGTILNGVKLDPKSDYYYQLDPSIQADVPDTPARSAEVKRSRPRWLVAGIAAAVLTSFALVGVGIMLGMWFLNDAPIEQPTLSPLQAIDAPVDVQQPAAPSSSIRFTSADPDTSKLLVRCDDQNARGTTDASISLDFASSCTVTIIHADRSRLTAVLNTVTAGHYRCFQDRQSTCESERQ
ncbi:MAG: polysaccharide biosynthesis tyrosine autokinase [Myxococcota bacterium]|nr:polysaccharide biosynthesis tyrosine autokinase [Myxococcota bacterium]